MAQYQTHMSASCSLVIFLAINAPQRGPYEPAREAIVPKGGWFERKPLATCDFPGGIWNICPLSGSANLAVYLWNQNAHAAASPAPPAYANYMTVDG